MPKPVSSPAAARSRTRARSSLRTESDMAANIKKLQQIKDRAAVAGVGASPQGTFPDSDPYTLAVQAFRNALDDCGLKKSDIDGLIVQGPGNVSFVRMGEMLGINPVVGANFDV